MASAGVSVDGDELLCVVYVVLIVGLCRENVTLTATLHYRCDQREMVLL